MWSYFCKNKNRSWLLWAVEHDTNTPLAFVFGPRTDDVLYELLLYLPLSTSLNPTNRKTIY